MRLLCGGWEDDWQEILLFGVIGLVIGKHFKFTNSGKRKAMRKPNHTTRKPLQAARLSKNRKTIDTVKRTNHEAINTESRRCLISRDG